MLPLIILSGPTASGKSKVAQALAEDLGAEIISADSMQVYRYFDIGTAKPSRKERERVRHHLIDILDPEEEFTAYDFKERALKHIEDIRTRGHIPVIAGGTGLYLKTLLENRDCAVSVSEEVRAQVRQEIRDRGSREMHAELAVVDPVYAGKIQPTDPARIERALSVHRETGKPLSEFHADDRPGGPDFESQLFVLETDRGHLYEKIDARVDGMIEQGLKQEVQSLLDRGYDSRLKPFQSIGYSQMVQHVNGDIPLDRTVYEIKRDTRHFAKRQMTWFRKMSGRLSLFIQPGEAVSQIKQRILNQMPLAAALLASAWFSFFVPAPDARASEGWFDSGVHQYQSGQWAAARKLLSRLLETGVDRATQNRARFLLGKIHVHEKHYDRARKIFESLVPVYPEIGDYILLELVRLDRENKNYEAGLERSVTLLKKFPRTLLTAETRILRADIYEARNDWKKALVELHRAERFISKRLRTQKWLSRIPELINRQIKLSKKLRAHARVYSLYRRLYIRYPQHAHRLQAKVQMDRLARNVPLTPRPLKLRETGKRLRGLLNRVEYTRVIREIKAFKKRSPKRILPPSLYFYLSEAHKGRRKRSRANIVLRQFLKHYPNHSRTQEARLLMAQNLWNLGNPSAAIKHLDALLKSSSHPRWTPRALFYQGRIYEDIRLPAQAIKKYRVLIDQYSQDSQAEQAAWRIGWIHFLAGDYGKAYDRFEKNSTQFKNGHYVDQNLFWMAKVAEKQKQDAKMESLFRELAARFPYTYYGLQAFNRLQSSAPESYPYPEGKSPFHKASLKIHQPAPPSPGRRLSKRERFHFERGSELIELGFYPRARLELLKLGKTIRKNLTGVMWLSHWYNRARGYGDSLLILQLFKDFKTMSGEKDLPKGFWLNFYPSAYSKIVDIQARRYNLDPWLVEGLIRQESMYNSRSLSPAGARGLMQIMPRTGKQLFKRSHPHEKFETDDLFDPETNIQLGVQYLSTLMRKYKGNGVHILITYNAGPKKLRAWRNRFSGIKDRDVWIESIPYPETRNYVKRVTRNYGIYKKLYPSRLSASSENKSF